MLKIKLSRVGKKNQPSYRVIVQEARAKGNGRAIDNLGHYHPLSQPAEIVINKTKYQDWITRGAQPTPTVKNLYRLS